MERMERQRLDTIRREGQAYGYGVEMGRRKAASDYYAKKRAEQEWRKDPMGLNRLNKFLWGEPPKKRKRRR